MGFNSGFKGLTLDNDQLDIQIWYRHSQ